MSDIAESTAKDGPESRRKRIRTTSNLTEQQLQQKRRVDRRAQRALRQRTKNCIRDLEQRLTQLQTESSERENKFIADLRTLQSENQALRFRLDNISRLASEGLSSGAFSRDLQGNSDRDPLNAAVCPDQSFSSPVSLEARSSHNCAKLQNGLPTQEPSQALHPDPPSVRHDAAQFRHHHTPSLSGEEESHFSHDDAESSIQRPSSDAPLDTHNIPGYQPSFQNNDPEGGSGSGPGGTSSYRAETASLPVQSFLNIVSPEIVPTHSDFTSFQGRRSDGHSMYVMAPSNRANADATDPLNESEQSGTAVTIATSSISPQPNLAKTSQATEFPSTTPDSSLVSTASGSQIPTISTILPQHKLSTCPLDHILLDFLRSRRLMAAEEVPFDSLLGPPKPSMNAIFQSKSGVALHPLSQVMSDILLTFAHVSLPEKAAFMYLMFHTMRWQISPNRDSYLAMPEWLRPTATQIAVPHGAWIDNIPWPGVRDMLIDDPDKYPFELFSDYYSQNVSINWPHESTDAVSHVNNDVVLHSIFERHIRQLKNWTVSQEFQERFSEMNPAIYSRQ